jgi:nucleotide-binding universal stress UspA family protein
MFKNMLIATDGSKHSERASEVGMDLAMLYGASVTALYVVDIGREYSAFGDLSTGALEDMIAKVRSSLIEEGEEATQKVKELARKAGIAAQTKVIEGYPADDILKMAKENDADLIVMGGIGATGVERFLLGSVADKVVRNSKVPVLVVRKD